MAYVTRPRSTRRARWSDERAFSLVETLVVCALISTLASIGTGVYIAALKTARVTRAIGDLRSIDVDIRAFQVRHNRYPVTLGEARTPIPIDPWGNPYVYTDLSQKNGKGKARKDGRLNPINSDFDLLQCRRRWPDVHAAHRPVEQGRRHPGARRRVSRARERVLKA